MLDRERVEIILKRRFSTATPGQIAAATNALMALDAELRPAGFDPAERLAGFLSQRSASADDDPLLRTAADRNASARR